MPKLPVKDRRQVEKAESVSGGFEPLPAGKYVGTLSAVEEKTSQAGNKYWNTEYSDLEDMDGDSKPGRQWYILMLPSSMPEDYQIPPKSKFKTPEEAWDNYQNLVKGRIKAWFEAHGYTLDTDTEEMLGEQAILQLGIETIQKGPKTGQRTNRVNAVLPIGDHEPGSGSGDDGDDF